MTSVVHFCLNHTAMKRLPVVASPTYSSSTLSERGSPTCGDSPDRSCRSSRSAAWEAVECRRETPIEDDFELSSKVLGSGLSGDVREGICRETGRAFAVKTFKLAKLSPRHLSNLRQEVDVLSSLDHEAIMQLHAVYETKEEVHLVLEKLTGGEVFDRLQECGRFDEASAASIAVQVLRALVHLHARGIIHRDLKPENIMYEDESRTRIKLIDFGFGTRFEKGDELNQMCGTIQYIAPEVLRRAGYNEKADIWSTGSVIYTLLTNKVMYGGAESEVKRKNKLGAIDFSRTFATVSKEGQDFARWLLDANPLGRPSAAQALRHPWLAKYAPEEVEDALMEIAIDEGEGCVAALRAEPRAQLRLSSAMEGEKTPAAPIRRNAAFSEDFRGRFRMDEKAHPRLLGAGFQMAKRD